MSGHPSNGCFKCGNTLHHAWQCPVKGTSTEIRKATHQQYFAENPEKKSEIDRTRLAKLKAKNVCREMAAGIQWNDLILQLQEESTFMKEQGDKLDTITLTYHHSFEGGSKNLYEKSLEIQTVVRDRLERIRNVIATAKKKLTEEDNTRGSRLLRELIEVRDAVWKKLTQAVVLRRNVFLTVNDIKEKALKIQVWCVEFQSYMVRQHKEANLQKYYEQYVEKYASYLTIKNLGQYIKDRAEVQLVAGTSVPMSTQVDQRLRDIESHLSEAKTCLDKYMKQQ